MIRTKTRGANSSLDRACSCAAVLVDSANKTANHAAPDFFIVILNTLRDLAFTPVPCRFSPQHSAHHEMGQPGRSGACPFPAVRNILRCVRPTRLEFSRGDGNGQGHSSEKCR